MIKMIDHHPALGKVYAPIIEAHRTTNAKPTCNDAEREDLFLIWRFAALMNPSMHTPLGRERCIVHR